MTKEEAGQRKRWCRGGLLAFIKPPWDPLRSLSQLIVITNPWYHCSWITNAELNLRKADSLAHGHTWLHMAVNNRTEISVQVCLFLKPILFLSHHSITSITSVASYLADPKEAQELPGHVLCVSDLWVPASLILDLFSFAQLPDVSRFWGRISLSRIWILVFGKFHSGSFLPWSILPMPSSSAVSEAKALPSKSSPMDPLSQTPHYLLS